MSKIFLTGSSGFVGKNVISALGAKYTIFKYQRGEEIKINEDLVLHFAGISNDSRRVADSELYYTSNFYLTKCVYDCFLNSSAKTLIMLSSVKAVSDKIEVELTEDYKPDPRTHYGKSKLLAENYIFSKNIPIGKRVYVLRACIIHGPGNKGNLSLLYKLASKGLPWPLGAFENQRSFCSIHNLLFVLTELIEREDIPSGVYNIADNEAISTNELVELMATTLNKKARILNISKSIISSIAKVGDLLRLPFNSERLYKLTDSYVVSNSKLVEALGKPLPVSTREGLIKTFNSFNS